MILQYIFLVKTFGSNLVVCAREGGANTTPFQAVHFALRNTKNKTGEKKASNRAKPEKQKGKKEGGLGEGIFALLRIKIKRFRFSLIKRNTKQKNFLFLLKEKIAREKIKKCRENFSVFGSAEAKRRRAEMQIIILDFVQKMFELHSENTATHHGLKA